MLVAKPFVQPSFTDLVKLSSSHIALQPLSEAAQITMPPHSPVVSMTVTIPPHPSTCSYSSTHDINNTNDDDVDKVGFTFPLDEEESVNDTNQPYETLIAGVVEKYFLTWENSTMNILTLLESTSKIGIDSGACGIGSFPPPCPALLR